MRCLIVQPIHADGLALLEAEGVTPVFAPDPRTPTVAGLVGDVDAVITRNAGLATAAIEAARRLRVVVVHGTGYDHVDMETATARGVLVCNTPNLNARSVAELALGLALAAARLIPAADRAERAGLPGFRESERFVELAGKTALVVGYGAIGSLVARMLRDGLGMRVLVHAPRRSGLDGFEPAPDLRDGLAAADLVTLHAPLKADTRGMIGRAALSAVRPGMILVNTARAGLVDEDALAEALADGRVAAAGLDDYGADAPRGPLAATGRVVFTPHLGATTEEALRRVALGAAESVVAALRGRRPATALNVPAGWSR